MTYLPMRMQVCLASEIFKGVGGLQTCGLDSISEADWSGAL